MFNKRPSQQHPPPELLERFKQSYPNVGPPVTSDEGGSINASHYPHDHEDQDPTPRAPGEPFQFTPSLLDTNSSAFAAFASAPPGYYTPTPGGQNTAFTTVSAELQTPTVGISIGTPLSLAPNATIMPPPLPTDLHSYAQTMQPHQFHNYQPFTATSMQHYHPSAFDPMPQSPGSGSPMELGLEQELRDQAALIPLPGQQYEHEIGPMPSSEKFRFHVTLNAPTAMIKHPDEIPITYLNKGQAYQINVVDTAAPSPSVTPTRYRTFIRISFHDEGQRQRPAACWQLWKEGRGTNEAHQRGGKLQAVEHVEPSGLSSAVEGDDGKRRSKSDLESASFDGFSVIWTAPPHGAPEATVHVRFNFLSTDFSHSKGVKGIPVRLCAKTEVLSNGSPRSPADSPPEVCFCKVKLFRDHGAERKLANDILHVKKTIEKLRQQLHQSEMGGSSKKRRASSPQGKAGPGGQKTGKALKHKRTWSMSSASSVGGNGHHGHHRTSAEDDLQQRLNVMQDMFTSTRPASVLYLRGSELDDPDLHPVQLTGEPITGADSDNEWQQRRASIRTDTTASSFVSPTPSSASINSSVHGSMQNLAAAGQEGSFPTPERYSSTSGPSPSGQSQQTARGQTTSPPDRPVKVTKREEDSGMLSGWIEAIGIDQSYQPPGKMPIKANMCIYILPLSDGGKQTQYYLAVYLAQRTVQSLTHSIARKSGIDPSQVIRTTHVTSRGFSVIVDDEVVQEMPEGQDMKVKFIEVEDDEDMHATPERDWNLDPLDDEPVVDGEVGAGAVKNKNTRGWELQLIY